MPDAQHAELERLGRARRARTEPTVVHFISPISPNAVNLLAICANAPHPLIPGVLFSDLPFEVTCPRCCELLKGTTK
jgi:hypothetical protein